MTSPDQKYQPSPEEVAAAEEAMTSRENQLSKMRETSAEAGEGVNSPWGQFANENGFRVVNVDHGHRGYIEVEFWDPKVGDKESEEELDAGLGNYIPKHLSKAYFKKTFTRQD